MPFCMHTVISEIRSPAIGPTMVAPRILSPPLAHEILTKPRVTPSHLQRSTASSGRMYVSYAVPALGFHATLLFFVGLGTVLLSIYLYAQPCRLPWCDPPA